MSNPKKILVVEDDAPSALLLSQILKKSGYTVFDSVDNGEKAVRVASEFNPDLILMDISIKGDMDGIDAAKMIRDECGIPSIYSTVSTDEKTIKRAKETYPYGYILKPYDKNMIYATVEMALHKIEMERRLGEVERRNRGILDALPDTFFYVNGDGAFADEVEKREASHIWTDKVSSRAVPVIRVVMAGGETEAFEYVLMRGGRKTFCEARIINAGDEKALVIVRDVTTRKTSEETESRYRSDLEESVRSRTRELTEANNSLGNEAGLRRKMEQSLKIFGHAIEQNPHLVAIIDRQGIVEYVNSAFTDISGYGRNQVVGTDVNKAGNLIVPEPGIWDEMTGSKTWKGELYGLRRDGRLYYLNASMSSILSDNGEISHYTINAEDVTSEKREKMALDEARESLEKSSQDFLNRGLEWKDWKEKMMERNISRTDKSLFKNIHNSFTQGAGFGTLVSLLDMMTASAVKSDNSYIVDSQIIDLIQQNVNLVKDAFKTFTSIDWIIANDFEMEKASLVELYEKVKVVIRKTEEYSGINDNRVIINEFNNRFRDISVNLNGDFFSRAFFEILINALKFSRRGSFITVFVNVMGKDAIISVINDPEKNEDGTVGIPVEYERVVFEPFYRLTKFVHEQYNTLEFGLGLTLVEKIVNKHGGDVACRNIIDHSDNRRESHIRVNTSIALPLVDK